MRGFERFPTWMWRNTTVERFVEWLRERNDFQDDDRAKAGFYGLDLYSLHRSIEEVVAYLDRVDPAAAERARERYSCLDHRGGGDGQAYGYAAAFGAGESCQEQVLEQLIELRRQGLEAAGRDGLLAEDERFYAERNAQREFLLRFDAAPRSAEALRESRLERAIGVIYRPDTERYSHYFHSRLADQFDAVIHIDETRAVEPLESAAHWDEDEAPETYPFKV